MSFFVGVKSAAIERCELVDGEMDWPPGLAAGRMLRLWSKSQAIGVWFAKRSVILGWTQVPPGEADAFLDACCLNVEGHRIHLLELRNDGTYAIIGNANAIQKKSNYARAGSMGGKQRVENERKRLSEKADSSKRSSSASSVASSVASSGAKEFAQATASSISILVEKEKTDLSNLDRPTIDASTRVDPEASAVKRKKVSRSVEIIRADESNLPKPAGLSSSGLLLLWRDLKGAGCRPCGKFANEDRSTVFAILSAYPDADYWRDCITRLAAIPFANGMIPTVLSPNGWRASLRWLLTNHERVAAGELDPDPAADPGDPGQASPWESLPDYGGGAGKWSEPIPGMTLSEATAAAEVAQVPACDVCTAGMVTANALDGSGLYFYRCSCRDGRKHSELAAWADEPKGDLELVKPNKGA